MPNIVGSNCEPKVVWHAATKRWIMALFLDGSTFGFLSSLDLKTWTRFQDLSVPGTAECPDFFEMPAENEPRLSKWVWTGANGNYLVDMFDGRHFQPEVMTQAGHRGRLYYAVQTFSDLPGNRRVQMSWMRGGQYPDMALNQQVSLPYELRLRKHGCNSYRMCALPVREIEGLRGAPQTLKEVVLKLGENPIAGVSGDFWDIVAEIDPATPREVGFKLRGRTVAYNVGESARSSSLASGGGNAPLPLSGGRVRPRILQDRASIEIFGNDGEAVMPFCFLPDDRADLEVFAIGGAAKIISLSLYPLKSIWRGC